MQNSCHSFFECCRNAKFLSFIFGTSTVNFESIKEKVSVQTLPQPLLNFPPAFIEKPSLPFLINAPNFIYHFNYANHFCINTCICVLINQYSTGLFVKSLLCLKKNPIVRKNFKSNKRRLTFRLYFGDSFLWSPGFSGLVPARFRSTEPSDRRYRWRPTKNSAELEKLLKPIKAEHFVYFPRNLSSPKAARSQLSFNTYISAFVCLCDIIY
jgi:hypothetical protein